METLAYKIKEKRDELVTDFKINNVNSPKF